MDTIINEMIDTFATYGLRMEEDSLSYIIKSFNDWFKKDGSKEYYAFEFLKEIGEITHLDLFGDYPLFIKRMGIEEEWYDVPEWFWEGLELEYNRKKDNFKVVSEKGKFYMKYGDWFKQENFDFFEKKMEQKENNEEYRIKKLFEQEKVSSEIMSLVNDYYNKIEEEFKDHSVIKELTDKIKNLAEQIKENQRE